MQTPTPHRVVTWLLTAALTIIILAMAVPMLTMLFLICEGLLAIV